MIATKKTWEIKQEQTDKLRWLMLFRVIFTTFLLGTTVIIQLREGGGGFYPALTRLYSLIIATYFLTFIYTLVLPRFYSVKSQAYFQSVGDVILYTAIIYLTGGIESIFSFMYILAIINASYILYRKGALIIASLAIIMYGGILDLQYYHYIKPFYTPLLPASYSPASDIFYRIIINMIAFYLTAYLSGYLSLQAEQTRQKLLSQQTDLERLERLNESIIESIDAGLLTLDPNGRVLSSNPTAERIIGHGKYQIVGRHYSEFFPELELPDREAAFPSLIKPWSYVHVRPDEQTLYLEMTLQALRDPSGASWSRLLVLQDKTDIRQMEEEVKRVEMLATLGELAAGIAHEIRTPLASMSGSIQMLGAELKENKEYQPYMKIVQREMDRLEYLVQDFLLFARPSKGSPARIDLSRTVTDIVDHFSKQTGLNGNITLSTEIRPDLFVTFDPNQLEQVLWNLLQNALDAMARGGELSVTVDTLESTPPMAGVMISDTGMGISARDISHIFDPFFTTKERGSGLGLSIVSHIVESGGGRINVFSQPQVGTTFTVSLPLS